MKKKQFFGLGVGLSSVIMIFVVLCLTTLAVLAYFCAKADTKLTDKKVAYASSYQDADVEAKEVLFNVDETLLELSKEQKGLLEFKDKYKGKAEVSIVDDSYIYYEVYVTDSISLCVKLKVNLSEDNIVTNDSKRYSIEQWKTVNVGYELEDEILDLWGN